MELFKKDLLEVMSKYFVIETKNLDVEWRRDDVETALVINTPVVGRLKGLGNGVARGVTAAKNRAKGNAPKSKKPVTPEGRGASA